MSVDEKIMMDWFQKLDPSSFDGHPIADAQDFLDRYHENLHNIGPVESNGVDFTTFS